MSDRKYKPRTSKKRKFCGNQHTRKSKTPRSSLTEQDIQINSVLLAMRCIGGSQAELETSCGLMDWYYFTFGPTEIFVLR